MYPILLHLGHFTLLTFGVLAAFGLMAALTLSLRTARLTGIDPDALWSAGLFSILSAFVLSRLLLVLGNFKSFLSYPLLVLALPSLNDTAILLTLLATALYLRVKRLPLLSALDAWAPCATLTWAFLSLGHLAEGSDPGLPTSVPWKILSPTRGAYLHPVALYAALSAAVITYALLRYLQHQPAPGRTTALALAASGLAQFLITFFRHPSEALDPTPGSLAGILDPIQWVASPCSSPPVSSLSRTQPPRSPMPSKNMLPKGQRRRTVKHEYRATRGVEPPAPPPIPVLEIEDDTDSDDHIHTFTADPAAAGLRLDQYLAQAIPDISRSRVQLLIDSGQVRVNGHPARPKQKLLGGEPIEIEGTPRPEPLHAFPKTSLSASSTRTNTSPSSTSLPA